MPTYAVTHRMPVYAIRIQGRRIYSGLDIQRAVGTIERLSAVFQHVTMEVDAEITLPLFRNKKCSECDTVISNRRANATTCGHYCRQKKSRRLKNDRANIAN